MTPYQLLMQRLQDGDRILIDGATGTEIERRGVPLEESLAVTLHRKPLLDIRPHL